MIKRLLRPLVRAYRAFRQRRAYHANRAAIDRAKRQAAGLDEMDKRLLEEMGRDED